MDSQFAHAQIQSPPHTQPRSHAGGAHHASLHFPDHQHGTDVATQSPFLQHHHHRGPSPLSALPNINVVGDAVFPSQLHPFQGSFGAVSQTGAGSHSTEAVVPAHNGFESVDGLPILLNEEDMLSHSRDHIDHTLQLQQQSRVPHAQTQQHNGRKQLPHQREQPGSASAEHPPQSEHGTLGMPHFATDTANQRHFDLLAATSHPQVRAITRIRNEGPEDFQEPPAHESDMTNMETSAITSADAEVDETRAGQNEQPRQQAQNPLAPQVVLDPPNLQQWRGKLFDLEDIAVLTHEEYETYFPHVDNVYSHRSTQRYKRKPFITHYWDCRMKGRPPGTPKSDDPTKKKRKRHARERNLCDVKIKITEYSAGPSMAELAFASNLGADVLGRVHGQRFWTIQRVNGNGTNGIGDGQPATHKHTLAKSDEIKKNSIQRLLAAREKDTRKIRKPATTVWKPPTWKPTGAAAATAKRRSKAHSLKLFATCFCPFSQRVWIALEAKGLGYQYCEIDALSTTKPTQLLEASPRGLVPALRHDAWACGESAVILEYLEDLDQEVPLRPTDPRLNATCRLWTSFINTEIVPSFYGLLSAADGVARDQGIEKLQQQIKTVVEAANEKGPYFLGEEMCLVDIHFAPFALRLSRIMEPYRGWTPAVPESRWQRWIGAMEENAHVRNTMSSSSLYVNTVNLLIQGGWKG